MLNFDLDKMLYCIPPDKHNLKDLKAIFEEHPEVKFVSFVGIDIMGNDTDEKIPISVFLKDYDDLICKGVQTDGSSVVLPEIAELNNAKVDIVPDPAVNWYVDHNLINVYKASDSEELPIGTLRIPSFLIHNNVEQVGSRAILQRGINAFKKQVLKLLQEHRYIFDHLDIDSYDDIEEILLTSATELEFWVKTPDDQRDMEELSTAQILKEQYWKRTVGPVRSALEKSLMMLDKYGFEMEMGHKEVGGAKAKMSSTGNYDQVMEQLEIDWKYASAMQAADNENMVKYVVRDVFRVHGLDVTFAAKPMPKIAGSGEHTHLGLAAKLKNGKIVNLFSHTDMNNEFASPVGFGAIMGLMKNYEAVNPFVASNNDSFNRLKPGYEAPVCVVTSLGHEPNIPSRNRTVLLGLIRDTGNPLATRFELRGPCPKSNTYLVIGMAYMAMLDGITAVLENEKTAEEAERSLSKKVGEEDFYLEKDRMYRSEENVYEAYSEQERELNFGKTPVTVWENLMAFVNHPEKVQVLKFGDVMDEKSIASYKTALVNQWKTELHDRIVPSNMDIIRNTVKLHDDSSGNEYDDRNWKKINELRKSIGKSSLEKPSLLSRIISAIDEEEYAQVSKLQIEMMEKMETLSEMYSNYKKNLF